MQKGDELTRTSIINLVSEISNMFSCLVYSSGGSRISHRGRQPRSGGIESRGSYILKILHVETKESGPMVGGSDPGARPLDPQCTLMGTYLNHGVLFPLFQDF